MVYAFKSVEEVLYALIAILPERAGRRLLYVMMNRVKSV